MVRTPIRGASNDFATALTLGPDNYYILAAGAGGDFGFARFSIGVGDVNGTFAQSRTDHRLRRHRRCSPSRGRHARPDRFVLAGSAGGDLAVARYHRDGVLDRTSTATAG